MLAALWDAIEGAGDKPRANTVIAFARTLGYRFREGEALRFLRGRIENREAIGETAGSKREANFPRAGSIREAFDRSAGICYDAGERADLKGLSLKRDTAFEITSVISQHDPATPRHETSSFSTQTSLLPEVEKPAKKAAIDRRTPTEAMGHAIRDAIGKCVGPFLTVQTITGWKRANGTVALDMAQAGVTPEQAVDFWILEHERTGSPVIMLSALQRRMAVEAAREGADDSMPPLYRPDGTLDDRY